MQRTVVNRIWERLLGRGIVENSDEMDGEPWSPELLDWLASDFVGHGYDLKRLIATIATSRTYQMPAGARPRSADSGPGILHSRQPGYDAPGSGVGKWRDADPLAAARRAQNAGRAVSGTSRRF